MNKEDIIKEGIVTRPFEVRIISDELRARVLYFQNLLHEKRIENQSKNKKSRRINKI